jgi:uncharacterized protein YbjT (DUF2867 family)
MAERRVVLAGATGLVGRAVMSRAVGLDGIRLAAVARRRIALPAGARMEMFVADTSHWAETIEALRPHLVISALGTTWHKAGKDEDAFRAVDETLVLDVARAAKAAGARHFIVVSSAGANRSSRHLYLQVKAEVEEALSRLRFERLDILRPGLLRGRREDDPRGGERMAMLASPLLDLLLQGKYREYRSISASRLADVILLLCQEKAGGRFLHDRDSLLRLLRRASAPA